MKVSFNIPLVTGRESKYLEEATKQRHFCGDDHNFTARCREWLKVNHDAKSVLMTPSCTHALEMSAFLYDLKPGDEVILPSFTFVSTANAYAARGATLRFVDIDPATMCLDLKLVERVINSKTKIIVPVHYAGVSCDMNRLMEMARSANVGVVANYHRAC